MQIQRILMIAVAFGFLSSPAPVRAGDATCSQLPEGVVVIEPLNGAGRVASAALSGVAIAPVVRGGVPYYELGVAAVTYGADGAAVVRSVDASMERFQSIRWRVIQFSGQGVADVTGTLLNGKRGCSDTAGLSRGPVVSLVATAEGASQPAETFRVRIPANDVAPSASSLGLVSVAFFESTGCQGEPSIESWYNPATRHVAAERDLACRASRTGPTYLLFASGGGL